jgi:hypothetical protein
MYICYCHAIILHFFCPFSFGEQTDTMKMYACVMSHIYFHGSHVIQLLFNRFIVV